MSFDRESYYILNTSLPFCYRFFFFLIDQEVYYEVESNKKA